VTRIDAHVHVGESLQGFGQAAGDVLAEMERLGIDRSVLVPVRPVGYAYEPENERVAGLVREGGGRFWGLGRVDPRHAGAGAEARRCLGELGLQGLYVHPWEDAIGVTDHRLGPVAEACAEAGTPLLVEAGYPWVSEAPQVAELAARHPEVAVVMTNGGQINSSGLGQRNAWLALEGRPNLSITTSGVYREDFLEEVISGLGAERVLFGSASPLFDQDLELRRAEWAHVDEAARAAVLGANAERLFGGRGRP
jgi:predicted TIM-barrel fold metal-dependent hydrolase